MLCSLVEIYTLAVCYVQVLAKVAQDTFTLKRKRVFKVTTSASKHLGVGVMFAVGSSEFWRKWTPTPTPLGVFFPFLSERQCALRFCVCVSFFSRWRQRMPEPCKWVALIYPNGLVVPPPLANLRICVCVFSHFGGEDPRKGYVRVLTAAAPVWYKQSRGTHNNQKQTIVTVTSQQQQLN